MKAIAAAIALCLIGQTTTAQMPLPAGLLAQMEKASIAQSAAMETCAYSFVETVCFARLGDHDQIESSDTTICLVSVQDGNEVQRKCLYSSNGSKFKSEKKSKPQKSESYGIFLSFSADSSAYNFSLLDSSGELYTIEVIPKNPKPVKGQIRGLIHVAKSDYLVRIIGAEIPRAEKVKGLHIRLQFTKVANGLIVPARLEMTGRASAILGLIKLRFRVDASYADYQFGS